MLSGPFYLPPNASRALILLHGYGADGADLISLADELADMLPQLAVFAPNAPDIGVNGYEWFSLDDYFTGNPIDESYLRTLIRRAEKVVPQVQAYVDSVCAQTGLEPSQIILGGFSQGGLVAALSALTGADKLAGLVMLSTVPLVPDSIQIKHKIPVLLTHGGQDTVVPPLAEKLSAQTIQLAGLSVTEHISPLMGHGIDESCINALKQFLLSLPQ